MIDFHKLAKQRSLRETQNLEPRTQNPTHRDIINSLYSEYSKMTDSAFDPNIFLDAAVSEPSIKRPPIPVGRELVGVIGEPKVRSGFQKLDPTKAWTTVDLPIEFDLTQYPDILAVCQVDKVTIIDGVMLDLTPNKTIDNSPGKNAKMRRYREATGLNSPGQSFSFRMLQGRLVKCKIKWRQYEGENYDDIDAVSAP